MARAKVPSLALEPAQEQAALLMLKRFLDERFELQLGTFEVQEVLEDLLRRLLLRAVQREERRLALGPAHYRRPSQLTKFCSSCRPWVWLFSGWNCTAKREPSASAAAKSLP